MPSTYENSNSSAGCTADGMAPACISAIKETDVNFNDTRCLFPGYDIDVYPLYTEFVHKDSEKPKRKDYNYDTSVNTPVKKRNHRNSKKMGMTYQRFEDPEGYEKRLSPVSKKTASHKVPKRGKIRYMSKKSSIELRKRTARSGELVLWIDFTFSDDVLEKLTITERAQFSYYCMKRLIKYVKETFSLHLIWKREYKERRSGRNKGEIMPHFHVLFGGMTPQQKKVWISICTQILIKWVALTGTENVHDALAVAINKKSYRRIENPKHATCYISKYFSKDDPLDIPEEESIGRCWGKSENLPNIEPIRISLSQRESFLLVRHLVKKKNLSKRGFFIKFQLQRGFPTFLFEDEEDVHRYLSFIKGAPYPYNEQIPF